MLARRGVRRGDPAVTVEALARAGLITLRRWEVLSEAGIETVGQLLAWSDRDLLALPGLGPAAVANIREAMHGLGLSPQR